MAFMQITTLNANIPYNITYSFSQSANAVPNFQFVAASAVPNVQLVAANAVPNFQIVNLPLQMQCQLAVITINAS
jgi:hypothetical protein